MMIRTVVAFSAILAVGAVAPAFAQEQIEGPAVNGTIQSIDESTRTVVLDNGQSYTMGESADMDSLRQGAQVDLSCDAAGTNCMVVSADMQNDVGPESETAPSAGTNDGGTEDMDAPGSTDADDSEGGTVTPDTGGATDSN